MLSFDILAWCPPTSEAFVRGVQACVPVYILANGVRAAVLRCSESVCRVSPIAAVLSFTVRGLGAGAVV